MPAFLEIENLTVRYTSGKGILALDRVDMVVDRGSFVCIIGPSGCGKTTLLQVIGGFVQPTTGEVRVDGRKITKAGRDRGVVFQQPALYPWMSVYRNAEFGLLLRHMPRYERAAIVEAQLKSVGLWEFRDHWTYQLSGGMQQRLAIVRAIANDPEILLMDEPFGALDALTRELMQEELRKLWQRTGKTIILITHSVDEAVYLGTQVTVMSARPGRIIETAPLTFSRQAESTGPRSVKSSPEFIAIKEHILGLVLRQPMVEDVERTQ